MKSLKAPLIALALFAALAAPVGVSAQAMQDHAAAPMNASMTAGVIRKVDKDNGKVTIKHGDIKHLDMPGMTMVFDVKDKALLAPFKAGDKVQFMVVDNHGNLVITDLKPAQ